MSKLPGRDLGLADTSRISSLETGHPLRPARRSVRDTVLVASWVLSFQVIVLVFKVIKRLEIFVLGLRGKKASE